VKNTVLVLVPQAITAGNLAAGLGTIWCAFDSRIGLGVMLNFVAMALDLMDGAAARKFGVTSNFGKHFDTVSDEELQHYVDLINNRPRKRLGYLTPAEVFSKELKKKTCSSP